MKTKQINNIQFSFCLNKGSAIPMLRSQQSEQLHYSLFITQLRGWRLKFTSIIVLALTFYVIDLRKSLNLRLVRTHH